MGNKRLIPALILFSAHMALAGTLVLKRGWVDTFKDRSTIDATFTVDHAHKTPNAPAKDADMHVARRAPKDVGLPMVAEMVNAFFATSGNEKNAITLIHQKEVSGDSVTISGAWRLWFEHPANSQKQFANVPKAQNTNPDHSFEIHPITKFAGQNIETSFRFIKDFQGKDPGAAFGAYEKLSISVRTDPKRTSITLDSKKIGFNYVHFRMRLLGNPFELADHGFAVLADVEDDGKGGDEVLASKVRMIFVPETEAWKRIQKSGEGDELDALGIPRVNLNAIAAFVDKAPAGTAVSRKLPYEMIIVAVK